jgi:hypothetical protein
MARLSLSRSAISSVRIWSVGIEKMLARGKFVFPLERVGYIASPARDEDRKKPKSMPGKS